MSALWSVAPRRRLSPALSPAPSGDAVGWRVAPGADPLSPGRDGVAPLAACVGRDSLEFAAFRPGGGAASSGAVPSGERASVGRRKGGFGVPWGETSRSVASIC